MAKQVILINGPMCSGKTDLVRFIEAHPELFEDYLNTWEKEDRSVTVSFEQTPPKALGLFYKSDLSPKDRSANTDLFEICMGVGRIVDYLDGKYNCGLLFLDQSLISGAETYCQNSFEQGNLTHRARDLYQAMLKLGIDSLGRNEQDRWCEQIIVYLRVTDPEILLKRLKQRATPGEAVDQKYLSQMIDINEQFIANKDQCYTKHGLNPPRVLTIDASHDFTQKESYHRDIVRLIIAKLREEK